MNMCYNHFVMRDLFNKIKKYLSDNEIDGLYFNSSNEFLMEYNILELNSSYKLTGFSGSQSMGLCTKDKVYLLVDTRYHAQADIEVKEDFIDVVKVPLTKSVTDSFIELLPKKFKLGIPSKKISKTLYELFQKKLSEKNGKIILFDEDAIEHFEKSFVRDDDYEIYEIPPHISGRSIDDKISDLMKKYKGSTLIITDLSDISYFTNLRSFNFPYISSFPSKLLITSSGGVLYLNSEVNFCSKLLRTKYFNEFYNDLKTIKNSKIFYENINMFDYLLIDKSNKSEKADFSLNKSIKNDEEIEHMKQCFSATDKSLSIIEDMLNSKRIYSEFDYSDALVKSLYQNGACSLSFKPIVACGSNSAIIHYGTPSKDKLVKNGDFLLIDFGAYFEGGYATDTTRTFIKGSPSKEQQRVYTTVMKAFLNAYHRSAKQYYDIDKHARDIIDKELGNKYPFSHSTGHGVGINVHEVPPRVSNTDISKIDLIENTVFSIEPGAYKLNFGGVRLENTVYLKKINGKLKPQSLSKYKFEEKLVDKTLLNSLELSWYKNWQEEYERTYLRK